MANGVTLPRSTAFRFAPAVRSVSRLAFPFVDVVVVPWSHFDCVRKKNKTCSRCIPCALVPLIRRTRPPFFFGLGKSRTVQLSC